MMANENNSMLNWNERYLSADTPWRHDNAHENIIKLVQKYAEKSAAILEIGCGTGQEAIALSHLGFDLLAIDLSEKAIEIARSDAVLNNSQAKFQVMDFLRDNNLDTYDVIIDIACLHTYKTSKSRALFADQVVKHLNKHCLWINLSCAYPAVEIVESQTGVRAPPALSLKQLAETTEKSYQMIEIQSTEIPIQRKGCKQVNFPAWVSVLRKLY